MEKSIKRFNGKKIYSAHVGRIAYSKKCIDKIGFQGL